MADVAIADFLTAEGFDTEEAQSIARGVLEAEGLTRAGKQRMVDTKREAAHRALATFLSPSCAGCREVASADADGRAPVIVSAEACHYCKGSANRRAVSELIRTCRRAGVTRVLVVGGTPNLYESLERLTKEAGGGITWRFVEATESVITKADATNALRWSEVAAIWAPTPLPHKVSNMFTENPEAKRARLVVCHQRGIAALCSAIVRTLGAR
ncbi:MAG TPA: hypothetical protein V6D47_18485 [Oscillatoriaceae cyanobacterium]